MPATIEEILARDGRLVYKTRGVSMEPMLRQNRDLVIVQPAASRLKKYDVALYKRGEAYVLHRVMEDGGDHYLIRGDNTYSMETVPDGCILGVLTGFLRKGKQHDVTERGYQLYASFWTAIYPARRLYFRGRSLAARIARRLGITPLIRKIMALFGGVR